MPFAADSGVHFPASELDPTLQHSVTFVGSHDATRAELLESIADLPLRVYGNAWNRLSRDSKLRDKVVHRSIFDHELRRVVTSSAVSLNILRRQNAGAHNMRSFELPAMGATMVTSRSREQAEWFPEREACLMYDDKAELRKSVESLLDDPRARQQLRAAALQRARSHTYLERARNLLEIATVRTRARR
jgi:spore maturation protein CgeB